MKDQLHYRAEHGDRQILPHVTGFDRIGNPIDFQLDAEHFADNLHRQARWTEAVVAVNRLYQAMLETGTSPAAAWSICEPLLPADLVSGTALRPAGVDGH